MDFPIKLFSKGIHNTLIDTEIPREASSGSYNWITQSGRIILAGGRQLVGTAGVIGKINGLWTGYKTNGDKVIYRKTADKIQYFDGTDWADILTSLTDTDISFANYSSLAGAFTLINGADGFWLINNANPDSAVDLYDSAKNFKGYIIIDKGRCLLWNRDKDKTGLYGSYIDLQNSTVYTTVTAEAIAGSGTGRSGTLAFKASGAKRVCFGVTFTDGTETFTDNYDGTLTGSAGGTGTINYATGAYDITFNASAVTVTSTYQWQDFTAHGLADFTKSATRLAGEGFQFPQDEGGDAILNVLIGQDGAYYSIKSQSAYRLAIEAVDTNATNDVYRKDLGLPNWRCAISTSKGIVFINNANPVNPVLTILRKNELGDSVEPYVLCPQFNFALYNYEDACIDTYDRYVIIACKTLDADENNTILFCNLADNTVDIVKYEARVFTKDGIKLYVGSPITQDVYQILVGFDDESLAIENEWISKGETYGTDLLKKFKRLRFKGIIDPDQNIEVWGDFDNAGFSLLATIEGSADYVDYSNPQTIGSNFIGGAQIGGDDMSTAYPFICELRVRMTKFNKRNLKFIATGIGYAELQNFVDFDILPYENKLAKKYRTKRT